MSENQTKEALTSEKTETAALTPGLYWARTPYSDWWNVILRIRVQGWEAILREEKILSLLGSWKGRPMGFVIGPRIEEPAVEEVTNAE